MKKNIYITNFTHMVGAATLFLCFNPLQWGYPVIEHFCHIVNNHINEWARSRNSVHLQSDR